MSESIRIADHLWNDAESLVDRIEHTCRVESCSQLVYDAMTGELLPVAGAALADLWVTDRGQRLTLSRSGVSVSPSTDRQQDFTPSSTTIEPAASGLAYGPPTATWSDRMQLTTTEQISPYAVIGLTLQFDKAVDGTLSRPLCELCETLLGLVSSVYLRHRFAVVNEAIDSQDHRDRLLDRLNDGANLQESLAIISATIAAEISADRVSLLQTNGKRAQMISSSTQPRVDRRARQVRLLESLVAAALSCGGQFHFTVGQGESGRLSDLRLRNALNEYLAESGSREIQIEAVYESPSESDNRVVVGAITIERFRLSDDSSNSELRQFTKLRAPAVAAIGRAFQRDRVSWPLIASRLAGSKASKRLRSIAVVSLLTIIALCLIPGELKIPVEGRLTATRHQRLYAPANGVISNLHIGNGAFVTAGTPLIEIRSANLDQQQRQLEGAVATAKTRLAAVIASRSRSAPSGNIDRNSVASSNEQVLETEIAGLEAQLKLIEQQQAELKLSSPIDGHVDRWDLQQSLAGRPVVHGQFLLDVVSKSDGWRVELDIPDAESQYVLDAQANEACQVTFRLRSSPDTPYSGQLQHVSGVTQFDRSGQSVLRCTFPVDPAEHEFRSGATVIAKIHCGSRPIGFIWFRSLIEWARQVDWF